MSTCWRTRASPSTPFAYSTHQLSSLAAAESFAGVPTKDGKTRAKRSSSIAGKRASPRSLQPPNMPQKNGVSERVGRTLCSLVRCLLVDSGLPPKLWGELMLTAAYLCHRMPHSGLDMETPFKWLYGKEANLSHLKIIGARAFVYIKDAKKLEPKSWEGMLCGFSEDEALSYRIWNPKTRRVVEIKNVTIIQRPPHLISQPT